MKFPIVIIKSKESPIYFFDCDDLGLVSKGGETFYNNGIMYDSDGTKYLIKGVAALKKAPILKSLRYFQPMFIADIKRDITGKVTLEEFKKDILSHIRSHSNYWIKKDLIDSLEASIIKINSIEGIIKFIK